MENAGTKHPPLIPAFFMFKKQIIFYSIYEKFILKETFMQPPKATKLRNNKILIISSVFTLLLILGSVYLYTTSKQVGRQADLSKKEFKKNIHNLPPFPRICRNWIRSFWKSRSIYRMLLCFNQSCQKVSLSFMITYKLNEWGR